MYFLSWIIVGLVAGWSAGKILKGQAYGPFMDIAMGICGAVVGGMLMRSAGFGGYGGNHHYDSRCRDWCSPSDAACGFGERQKDVRSAALSVK